MAVTADLYCKQPLRANDKHKDAYDKDAVYLNVPYPGTNSVEVQILEVINDKTFHVYRGLD